MITSASFCPDGREGSRRLHLIMTLPMANHASDDVKVPGVKTASLSEGPDRSIEHVQDNRSQWLQHCPPTIDHGSGPNAI